jgi:endoglucanase
MVCARADLLRRWTAVLVAVVFVGLSSGCGGSSSSAVSADALAGRFLDRYVQDSGAVVRSDQGGDVVSEGQAYAMVLAEIAGRPSTVRTVWRWTSSHLQRGDGLVSWHARADGTVVDPQSAADGDVLLAWALLDYRGPSASALNAAGRRLAAAVLAHETVGVGRGRVLAAGPWAVSASPPVVNPSYWMPSVFRSLAAATGDARWRQMADSSVRLLAELTHDGEQLPPDWASVDGGRVVASGPPGSSDVPGFGPDAARLPVWLAVDCTSIGRQLAGHWWALLRDQSAATARGHDGSVRNANSAPLSEVAAALSARAAGADDSSAHAMTDATASARKNPTYYGDAWVALGAAMRAGRPPAC